MQINTQTQRGVLILSGAGEIDIANVTPLKELLHQISKDQTPRIVFDFQQITFIDSSVLGAMVSFFKSVREYNGKIRLAGLRPVIARTFSLTKLDEVFEIYEQLETAIVQDWGD